jgi:anthranilate synthase component 2
VYGGSLTNLPSVYHGVATTAKQIAADYLFNDLPETLQVGRYHSWVVANETVPNNLIITSVDENNHIMSMKHRIHDVRGVQYHPESVLTPDGKKIIENWVQGIKR